MKIELDTASASSNAIESYSHEGIMINKVLYQNSILVCPGQAIEDWSARDPDALNAGHFVRIFDLEPELVLLGTGRRLRFPDQQLIAAVMTRNIGMEIMDTAAACRAYNYLAGEGRKVVAALLSLNLG